MKRLLIRLCACAVALTTTSCDGSETGQNSGESTADRLSADDEEEASVDRTVRLFPFSIGGRTWGYMDREGNEVIRPRFRIARNFWEGLAYVFDKTAPRSSSFYFIDERGEQAFVLPPNCLSIKSFSEGLAAFRVMNREPGIDKWGFLDREGNVVIEPKYDKVDFFHEGAARVCVNVSVDDHTGELYDGDWGYVNKTGRTIVEPKYFAVQGFSDGLAWVYVDGSAVTYIDKSGEVALQIPRQRIRSQAAPFHEGLASFQPSRESGVGFIDKTGKLVIEPQFASAESFSEGLAAVAVATGKDRYKWGYIDRTGRLVLNAKYDDVSRFSEGRAAVRVGEFWGVIKRQGNYVVKPGESPRGGTEPINEVLDFRGGLTYVHVGGERDPDQFGEADPFGDWAGGAWYYMDRDGQIVRRYCKDAEGSPD